MAECGEGKLTFLATTLHVLLSRIVLILVVDIEYMYPTTSSRYRYIRGVAWWHARAHPDRDEISADPSGWAARTVATGGASCWPAAPSRVRLSRLPS